MSAQAMNIAIKTAAQSPHQKWKLGSVVLRGGRVLATGCNRNRNDPSIVENEKYFKCSIHAKVSALRNTGKTRGAKLFVARLTKNGSTALAKPCGRCQHAIEKAGIRRVYYTTDNGDWSWFKVS